MGRLTLQILVSIAFFLGCGDRDVAIDVPSAPVVSPKVVWIAHPGQVDGADAVPRAPSLRPEVADLLGDRQATAQAAAFYLHPTTDFGMEPRTTPLETVEAAELADQAVRYQASVLNGAARIWAPRYRQASLGSVRSAAHAHLAFETAYRDIEAAFDAFLNESKDLPIILLGHGQGATHLVRLLRERFDGGPLTRRLVVAYLAGELVGSDTFTSLGACRAPDETACFASWATMAPHATPRFPCGSEQLSRCGSPIHTRSVPVACFNPVSGGSAPSLARAHRGAGPGGGAGAGPFFDFVPGLVGAACDSQGLLRIDARTEVEGFAAHDFAGVEEGDYHPQDINLFYLDLRADAARRLGAWSAKTP